MEHASNTTRDIQAMRREQLAPAGATRHGVVVGVERYADERLNLRCAADDARAIYNLMIDPNCGCFPKENVTLLLDADATHSALWRALASLRRRAAPGDVVWIYFAGHAAPEGNTVYWAPHDADVDDLFATGLGNDRIARALDEIQARRVVMMLDCCHAAATALQRHPMRALLTADDVFAACKGEGRITFSSSDGSEKSVELTELGHGAFTWYLHQGLRGEADRDGDGVVTAEELWDYLRDRVSAASIEAGNPQTPKLIGELTHGFPLTLNPAALGRLKALSEAVLGAVRYGSDYLNDDEADYCIGILRRGVKTPAERQLLNDMGDLADGSLTPERFKRLTVAARAAAAMLPIEVDETDNPAGMPPVTDSELPASTGTIVGTPAASSPAPPPSKSSLPPPLPQRQVSPGDQTRTGWPKTPPPPPPARSVPQGGQRITIPVRHSRMTACLLGIFLGIFGVHNFYLGRHARGVAQLLLTLTISTITPFVVVFVVYLWALIEVVGIALHITPVDSLFTYTAPPERVPRH